MAYNIFNKFAMFNLHIHESVAHSAGAVEYIDCTSAEV